jgi:hypothetical protein
MPVTFDKMDIPIMTAIINKPNAIPKNSNNCIHAGFVLRYVCILLPFSGLILQAYKPRRSLKTSEVYKRRKISL